MASATRGAPPTYFDERWLDAMVEDVLDPDIPIIDAHHHLWHRPPHSRYLIEELLADISGSGHNVRGTVFVECGSMYRVQSNPQYASVGEVEFANGMGAMAASGIYGQVRVCAGIVGKVDLRHGDQVDAVLETLMQRAPDRLRGIRQMAAWDASPQVNTLPVSPPPELLGDAAFRTGFSRLSRYGLSFDAWLYHPQLPDLIALADAFPETQLILNHMGGLAGVGPYASDRAGVFEGWRRNMRALAERPNVAVKLGGIGMRLAGFGFPDALVPPSSVTIARAWQAAFDVCLEAFGPSRAMFESNFPIDKGACSYRTVWNVFKRLAHGCSSAEKSALFAGTAASIYRLPTDLAS